MPPVTIPFARKEAYRNPEYTRAMADLMIQKSQEDARLRLARGQSVSNAWGQFGNVVMSSLTDIQQKRALDEKVARDLQQQQIENDLRQREFDERKADREADLQYRREQTARQTRIDNETLADKAFERMPVGEEIDVPEYQRRGFTGTSVGEQLQPMAAMAERLPAVPMIESMGIPSYPTGATGAATGTMPPGSEPVPPQSQFITGPRRPTMSQDTAARPERFRRNPTQPEAMQIEANARLKAQQDGLEWNRLRDDERQRLRDIAEDDYREATLALRRQQAANAGDGKEIVVQGPNGPMVYTKGSGGAGAVPIRGADGQIIQKWASTDPMGSMQNIFDSAISNVVPNKRGPLVERANRLMAEGNTEELKTVITNAVLESTPATIRERVQGRMETVSALQAIRNDLTDLQKRGVPTGWLTGTVEDLTRKLGTTGNPEYVALGNRIGIALANYRRSMTGAAWTESEGKEYLTRFPGYQNDPSVNMAQIGGLLDAFNISNRSFWSTKLGPQGADLLGYGGTAPAGGSGGGGGLGTITRDANGNIVVKPGG